MFCRFWNHFPTTDPTYSIVDPNMGPKANLQCPQKWPQKSNPKKAKVPNLQCPEIFLDVQTQSDRLLYIHRARHKPRLLRWCELLRSTSAAQHQRSLLRFFIFSCVLFSSPGYFVVVFTLAAFLLNMFCHVFGPLFLGHSKEPLLQLLTYGTLFFYRMINYKTTASLGVFGGSFLVGLAIWETIVCYRVYGRLGWLFVILTPPKNNKFILPPNNPTTAAN